MPPHFSVLCVIQKGVETYSKSLSAAQGTQKVGNKRPSWLQSMGRVLGNPNCKISWWPTDAATASGLRKVMLLPEGAMTEASPRGLSGRYDSNSLSSNSRIVWTVCFCYERDSLPFPLSTYSTSLPFL